MKFLKPSHLKTVSVSLLTLISANSVLANDGGRSIVLQKNHRINGGVTLAVSPKGQNYFIQNFDDFIYRVTRYTLDTPVDVEKYHLAKYQYQMAQALDLDHLPSKLQKHSETINKISSGLRDWLTGFELKDPRLSITAKNFDYKGEFKRLSVFTDINADKNFKADLSQGPVIVLEAEIPNIELAVQKIQADDLANSDLRGFEIRKAKLSLLKDKLLNIRIVAQMLRKNSKFSAHVLSVKTNIESTHWDFTYEKPIKLPKLVITFNDQPMTLNTKPVEDMIDQNEKDIIKALISSIDQYAEATLPKMIEEQVSDSVDSGLEKIDTMPPLSGPSTLSTNEYFNWGLGLGGFKNLYPVYQGNAYAFLGVDLEVFVEDPLNLGYNKLLEKFKTIRSRARFNEVSPKQYDFALSVNENFINQILNLSFKRGYFGNQVTSSGMTYSMLQPPLFQFQDGSSFAPTPTGISSYTNSSSKHRPYARAHVKITADPELEWSDKLGLRTPVEMEFDVIMALELNGRGGLKIVQVGFDESTVQVPDRFVKFYWLVPDSVMRKKVHDGVVAKLRTAFDKPTVLAENVPIPSDFLGVPVKILSLHTESTGNGVAFLDIDTDKLKATGN